MRVYTVADSSTTSVPLCRITSHTVTINADITIAKIPITTADTSHPAVRATVRMIEGRGMGCGGVNGDGGSGDNGSEGGCLGG